MAASCSRKSGADSAIIPHGGWRKLSDSVYEVSTPSKGYIDLEIVFFHGFRSRSDTDSYYRTWMKADGSANWLDTLLAETFPRARILSVCYDSSLITSPCTGRVDLYLLGETLVQSLVDLTGVGRTCPVVLVGHCLGGMVVKKIALCAEISANQERSERSLSRPYETFLRNVKGAFFSSTPSLGANVPMTSTVYQGGPLLKNLELLGTESARINGEFAKLCRRWRWRTYGVFAANETEATKFLQCFDDIGGSDSELDSVPQYLSVVPEASARAYVDGFGVISGVDHFTICQSSESFAHLISFLTKIKQDEERNAVQLQQSFGLHSKILDLDQRVKSVITELQLEKVEPLGLALVGIDGIGKSILAKQVVITVRHQFEYVCLVEFENVDRSQRKRQLERLIAQNLLYSSGRRVAMEDGEQPWFHIRGKKVLMVVDDVHSEDDINPLFDMDWCGGGSRLIITSNRQDWGRQLIVHQVPLLSKKASHELLATYVDEFVLKSIPKEMMSQVVDECGGLPLVLEVIGKYLWDKKEVRIWSGALQRLQMPDSLDGSAEENVVWKKLKVSFDSLGKSEKQIFLDVVIFDLYPTGKTQYDVEIFRSAWGAEWDEGLIDVALINLERRSFLRLVEASTAGSTVHARRSGAAVQVVWIHKQMWAMAVWISGQAEKNLEDRRRIWQFQNVIDLLTNCNKVSRPRTEVLLISVERKSHVDARPHLEMIRSMQWSFLGSLKALRLLRISDAHMPGADKLKFPAKLALLHMENCSREPQKEHWWLPYSRLSSWPLCDGSVEELGVLSVLILENCSHVQLPQNFHMLRCLKILRIHSDGKPMGPLSDNIGLLPALKHLSLNVPLKRLPDSLLRLPSLQSLVLSGEHLQAWPAVPVTVNRYYHMTALTKLHLKDLPALEQLPDTFGGLASLQHLSISGCSALEQLPEGFGALSELRTLSIEYCGKLEKLCESFSNLSRLHRLKLNSIPKLKMLPVTFRDLPSLKEMVVGGCLSIKELPGSFTNLVSLNNLEIFVCHALESLWPDSNYCHVDQGLPKSLEQLKSLEHLRLCGCPKLRYRPESLFQLTSLKRLEMPGILTTHSDDDERESLESLKQISSLCTLGTNSETLPASTCLPSPLKELAAHSSKKIACAFDSVTYLPVSSQDYQYVNSAPRSSTQQSSSTSLLLEDCTKSAEVPGSVGQLSNLQELNLCDCKFTSTFTPQLVSSKKLKLDRCRGVGHLLETMTLWTGMQGLTIKDCQTFSCLPDALGMLSLLTELQLVNCQDLVSLPESLGQLSSLLKLKIVNCKKLRYIPGSVGQLRNIRYMRIENCNSIPKLPDSLCHMTWLNSLSIKCQSFSSLPNPLGNLRPLTVLKLVDCQDCISLPESTGQLMSLRELEIVNCSKLTCLPESLGELRNLRTLHIENCRSISTNGIPDSVYHMTWLSDLRIFDYRPFESKIVRSLRQFTRLQSLGLSTWNKLICLQEFIGSVQLEVFRLPVLVVKCMECEDTVVPPEKEDYIRRILMNIDDSCGCIYTLSFLKWVENYLPYIGPFKWVERKYSRIGGLSDHQTRIICIGREHYTVTVTVVCGRENVIGLPWKFKEYALKG